MSGPTPSVRPPWHGLRARLFLSYLAVAAIALGVLGGAAATVAPTLFTSHMAGIMHGGAGMMGGQGTSGMAGMTGGDLAGMSAGAQASLSAAFQAAFRGALLYAALAAALAALAASAFVSHRVAVPIRRLAAAARDVAAGRYDRRVPSPAAGEELADLAARFNEMAAALEATEQRRLRLVGDVAHELRTPVATLQGYLEGLVDGVVAPDAETFGRLHAETGRLSRLIDDLQELSRAEAGQLSLDVRAVAPRAIADAAAARLRPDFRANGVALSIRIDPDLPPVAADSDRAVQVLTNLLTNALRHTPAGGTVCITARRAVHEAHEVELSVADTGGGIAPEHLPHVFERFYRADAARSRATGGSGIGLTISRALVEAMRGRIWAESAGPASGATFRFSLPIQDGAAATAAPASPA